MIDESVRIQGVVKKAGKWERPVRTSLNDLRVQQQGLAGEVRKLIEKQFANVAVFDRMLRQSADAMELAAKRIDSRLETAELGPFDQELENIANAGIQDQQKLALKRIEQLLEALKPDKQNGAVPPPMGGGDKPPMGGDKPRDSLPPLAQLKALRACRPTSPSEPRPSTRPTQIARSSTMTRSRSWKRCKKCRSTWRT